MFRILCVISVALLLGSCVSAPPRAVGLYGPEPVKQSIPGSNAQAIVSRSVEFNSEEIFEATKTAILRLGYITEDQDRKKGKIEGSGIYDCGGGNRTPITMAIYIQQINPEPLSKFTIIVDRHSWICWLGGETAAANDLASEVQKVLSTY
jgi:hypothetical protein